MSTKLDEWIKEHLRQQIEHGWDSSLCAALEEYGRSREWVEGPPPSECNAAYITWKNGSSPAIRSCTRSPNWQVQATSSRQIVSEDDITRHCPIPTAPPLPPKPPEPEIPEAVVENGSGYYKVSLYESSRVSQVMWVSPRTAFVHVIRSNSVKLIPLTDFLRDYPTSKWEYIEPREEGR